MGMVENAQLNQAKKNQEETNKRLDAIYVELRQLNANLAQLLSGAVRR